jgi:hypothetical protein
MPDTEALDPNLQNNNPSQAGDATSMDRTTGAELPAGEISDAADDDIDLLDELKDIDLLLEDIEDKIAPLAL